MIKLMTRARYLQMRTQAILMKDYRIRRGEITTNIKHLFPQDMVSEIWEGEIKLALEAAERIGQKNLYLELNMREKEAVFKNIHELGGYVESGDKPYAQPYPHLFKETAFPNIYIRENIIL